VKEKKYLLNQPSTTNRERKTMKRETDEMKTIKELQKIDENVSNYIDNTLDFLMKYGMSEQEASISIIKQFKRVLNN
jgi:hypothetical protein